MSWTPSAIAWERTQDNAAWATPHDLAQLAGDEERSFPGHRRCLDEENVAAGGRHGQAGGNAGVGRALANLGRVAPRAGQARTRFWSIRARYAAFPRRSARLSSEEASADLALEAADASLPRVLAHEEPERALGDDCLRALEPVASSCFGIR